jgi:hypothetical protein
MREAVLVVPGLLGLAGTILGWMTLKHVSSHEAAFWKALFLGPCALREVFTPRDWRSLHAPGRGQAEPSEGQKHERAAGAPRREAEASETESAGRISQEVGREPLRSEPGGTLTQRALWGAHGLAMVNGST